MFSGLMKPFGRNFLIGYLLPSILFVTVSVMLFLRLVPQAAPDAMKLTKQLQDVWAVSAAVIGTWAFSILLMALNRILVRLLEGYGLLQSTFFQDWQLRRFDRLCERIIETREQYKAEVRENEQVSPNTEERYTKFMLERHEKFPLEREQVLPTSFGNAIRAFETYPQALYGLDAIPVWPRILAVVPNAFKESLSNAKAQVDFWVNTFYLSLGVVIQYAGYAIGLGTALAVWIPISALAVCFAAYHYAVSSVGEWGDQVKTIFDLFRYDLLRQMGLSIPESWKDEHVYWQEISRSFLYWDKLDLPRGLCKNDGSRS